MLHKTEDHAKKTQIERIYALDPLMQDDVTLVPGTSVGIRPTIAQHNEIIAYQYSIGLIFELYESPTDRTLKTSIGITGDTKWTNEIHSQYQECDLMIVHLGTVDKEELTKGAFYGKHAGILGTASFLADKTFKYQLSIISEFGEELRPFRRRIMRSLVDIMRKNGIKGEMPRFFWTQNWQS